MKNKMMKGIACALCACLAFPMIACGKDDETAKAESYLTVDINPSVEFLLEGEIVVGVKAGNEDGATLIYGESFIGLKADECLALVTQLAEETGYLTTANATVNISVASDVWETEMKIEKMAQEGAEQGSEIARVKLGGRVEDSREVKKLQSKDAEAYKDLTPAKYRLITAVMQYDSMMTYEIGAKLSVKELKNLLEAHADEFEDFVGDYLEDQIDQAIEAAEQAIERQIVALCGTLYTKKYEAYLAYEKALKKLEAQLENIAISPEDEEAIKELLALADISAIGESGKITEEDVEKYLDKLRDLAEDTEERIEEILDKYDEEDCVLTEEQLKEFAELIEGKAVETLEDLEELVEDLKDSLEEEIEDFFKAHPELKEGLKELQSGYKKVKEEIKKLFKAQIEAKKAEFKAEKERRLAAMSAGKKAA